MFAAVCKAAGWSTPAKDDVEGIDDYIRQLTTMDPDSYSFRYTRSKKGDRSLPSDLKLINLRHFAVLIERLADFLDGLDAATVHLEEAKAEMEAEWRNEAASCMDWS